MSTTVATVDRCIVSLKLAKRSELKCSHPKKGGGVKCGVKETHDTFSCPVNRPPHAAIGREAEACSPPSTKGLHFLVDTTHVGQSELSRCLPQPAGYPREQETMSLFPISHIWVLDRYTVGAQ